MEEDLSSGPLLGRLGDVQLELVAGAERVEAQHEVHAGQEVAGGVSVQVLLQPPGGWRDLSDIIKLDGVGPVDNRPSTD